MDITEPNYEIIGTGSHANEQIKNISFEVSELIENVYYNVEPVRNGKKNEEGKSEHILNEILSNFGDLATTPEALDILIKENKTFDLFQKMFSFAIQQMLIKGTISSINIYLKDLSNPKFLTETIQNLLILKERGYKFAIDDFTLNHNLENLSFDNLFTLLANNIVPDYVKIDGEYLGKVFNIEYGKNHIRKLCIIIKYIKLKKIKIIGEWIGNKEEGYMARCLGIDLYQGKFLKDDFELDEYIDIVNNRQNITVQ